ncbi:MAG: proline dehydrogenase family protein [Bacillota bacterium]|nr:proline dehydrogenase family protein [Bacillota bacterium]
MQATDGAPVTPEAKAVAVDSILRPLFQRLAVSRTAVRLAHSRGLSRAARRFVIAEGLDEAIRGAAELNAQGVGVTLDNLAESTRSLGEAEAAAAEVRSILEAAEAAGLPDTNVSVKLTGFGIDLSEADCYRLTEGVVRRAAAGGRLVWIDMESSAYVDRTLATYRRLREAGLENVGVVLQAYLYRTPQDLEALSPYRPAVRIVKGAYAEPPRRALQDRQTIRLAFRRLVMASLQNGNFTAIATHDDELIGPLRQSLREAGIDRTRFEWQMLYGIRPELARRLVAEGEHVRLYVPFGRAWFPYFMRRLAERPADLWLLLGR